MHLGTIKPERTLEMLLRRGKATFEVEAGTHGAMTDHSGAGVLDALRDAQQFGGHLPRFAIFGARDMETREAVQDRQQCRVVVQLLRQRSGTTIILEALRRTLPARSDDRAAQRALQLEL